MRFSILALSAVVSAAGAASASDDLTIVSKQSVDGKAGDNTTTYISSDHVRVASQEDETIFDLKTGGMTTLDKNEKTYYRTTVQEMEATLVKVKERMNSPEAKKALERMKVPSAELTFDVKKTGETRQIAGLHCEEWAITRGPYSIMKECVTSELKIPDQVWSAYQGLLTAGAGSFGMTAKSGADFAKKMKAIKGYPVSTSSTLDVMGKKITTESEVTEVRRRSLPASTWEIPQGYKRIESPMMKAFDDHDD